MTRASKLPAVVGDVRVPHQVFTANPNGARTDLVVAKFVADCLFGLKGSFSQQIGGIIELDPVVVNEQMRPFVTAVVQDYTVRTRSLEGNREPTA